MDDIYDKLGRYEYHDSKTNSHKFYELIPTEDGKIKVAWGRIGARPNSQTISKTEAWSRITQKSSAGYSYVGEAQSELNETTSKPAPTTNNFNFAKWLGDD